MACTEELTKILDSLRVAVENKKENEFKNLLDNVLTKAKDPSSDSNTFTCIVNSLSKILENDEKIIILTETAKTTAEIAKIDGGRDACATCPSLMKNLIRLLISKTDNSTETVNLKTQACRALGNICFENEEGRAQILKGGDVLEELIKLLDTALNIQGANGIQLRNVSAGFLRNLLADSEDIQAKAIKLGIIGKLTSFLDLDCCDENVTTHILMTLVLLADSGTIENLLDEKLCGVLVKVMASTTFPEVSELCIELLHGQAENDDVKLNLAKVGLCELLLELIKKNKQYVQDEETRNLMKLTCDLIVLVLNGDESMEILYKKGEGEVFKQMINWLEDEDEDLILTAILAMGNFARTDDHCINMVEKGVGKKLLNLIAKNNTSNGDIRLQHALLSALKHLVIPKQNKATLIKDGIIETVLPMAEIPTFPVVFKFLGTFRMIIDGQEAAAIKLGLNKELLKKLVEWCGTTDHPGVQGEAIRLLAWLVKNSNNVDVYRNVIEVNGLPLLISMLSGEHLVMQNESLLALTLICASIKNNNSINEIISSTDTSTRIINFLNNGEKNPTPMIQNLLKFLKILLPIGKAKENLKSAGLSKSLAIYEKRTEIETSIKEILKLLD